MVRFVVFDYATMPPSTICYPLSTSSPFLCVLRASAVAFFLALTGDHMKLVCVVASAVLALAGPAAAAAAQPGTRPRPNVLFIIADDLNTQSLSCYGST